MSTFTTIAELQRLTDRELDILLRSVTQRLAGYAEGTPERRLLGDESESDIHRSTTSKK
jgi:hypothetical protein